MYILYRCHVRHSIHCTVCTDLMQNTDYIVQIFSTHQQHYKQTCFAYITRSNGTRQTDRVTTQSVFLFNTEPTIPSQWLHRSMGIILKISQVNLSLAERRTRFRSYSAAILMTFDLLCNGCQIIDLPHRGIEL